MAELTSGLRRTHYCSTLRQEHVGAEMAVCGWVRCQHDLGQLISADLRDRVDLLQLTLGDTTDRQIFKKVVGVRAEYALAVHSVVCERSARNPELPIGNVEIEAQELRILAKIEIPLFEIVEHSNMKEELWLKYHYLGLRRPDMRDRVTQCHRIVKIVCNYFDDNDFLEIEIPALIESTFESVRDYLVSSHALPGDFFALPQPPQQCKQLLMLLDFDRYMQAVRYLHNEDLRADHQPKFTRTDSEMSLIELGDVMVIGESFIRDVYRRLQNISTSVPFRRITWHEVMECSGFGKPDLHSGLELANLNDALKDTEPRVFADVLSVGGPVRDINLRSETNGLSRKETDKPTETPKAYGVRGLARTRLISNGESSSYERFLPEQEAAAVKTVLSAETGDVLLLATSLKSSVVFTSLGALYCEPAKRSGLIDDPKPRLSWVTDFPLFEYDGEENRYVATHHLLAASREEGLDKLTSDPGSVCAKAYDMAFNENEIGGGSICINTSEIQRQMFQALGFTPEQARQRFGFLADTFRYDTPPYSGMAFGSDHPMTLVSGCDSIRDVIVSSKIANPSKLTSSMPDVIDPKQLTGFGLPTIPQAE